MSVAWISYSSSVFQLLFQAELSFERRRIPAFDNVSYVALGLWLHLVSNSLEPDILGKSTPLPEAHLNFSNN